MKNKIFTIIISVIMMLGISSTIYAAITHTMMNDGGGGSSSSSSSSTSHTCSWGSYSTVTSPTCTTAGSEKASCTVSGCTKTTSRSIPATGHSYGSWYYYSSNQHKRDCNNCSSSETQAHNKNIKEDFGSNDLHDVRCDSCNYKWPAAHREKHNWAGVEGEHTCSNCGYVLSGIYHYYPDAGGDAKLTYKCAYNATGNPCSYSISLNIPTIKGLELEKYACSDATVGMPTPPPFPEGTYEYRYSGKVRNSPTSFATLTMPKGWLSLYPWSRKPVATHAGTNVSRPPSLLGQELQYVEMEYLPSLDIKEMPKLSGGEQLYDIPPVRAASLGLSNGAFATVACTNRLQNSNAAGWCGGHKGGLGKLIQTGGPYEPTYRWDGSQAFVVDYYPGAGAWMHYDSGLYPNQLFGYKSQGGVPIYADVYYCYRTLDELEVPKNGYEYLYLHSSQVVYNSGHRTVDVSVSPDMNKIDKTGYRYVGHSVSIGEFSKVGIGTKPTSSSATATARVSSTYTSSAAIVTFYIEPVKLSYGNKAIDYQGHIIDINAKSHEGEDLEFPDYYDESAGKCIIPNSSKFDPKKIEELESLNKMWWPGYILESAKVYKAGTTEVIKGSEITYDDSTTTYIDSENPDKSRYIVNERVPSFYPSEERGYAADKEFYYFYNTPTIEIEHKKYGTDKYMTTTDGKDIKYIKYMQQIINQYAYIDSLKTDNVKTPYTLNVSTAAGDIESFTYSYPSYDLVQIKISEVKDDGSLIHYATLYEDAKYKPSKKGYPVKNYAGVFAKYYSESLNAIAEQIGQTNEAFNTNKNWKVEFIYVEVERVYIKFKNLKGDSIFIPDPERPGKYIGEITAKIPDGGYTYTPSVLGNGRFVLVKHTINTGKYEDDLSKAQNISTGTPVTVQPNDGDKYIIFYYSTDKTITIEYRDENENTIKPTLVKEIPTTGTSIQIPKLDVYEIVGYKHDPEYDGVGHDLKKNDKSGNPIYGISGDMKPLTPDDLEISIPNPNEKDHHVIIYYNSKVALKFECREIGTNRILQTPPEYMTPTILEIPELGTKIQVPTILGYKVEYYLKDENYNGISTEIEDGTQTAIVEGINVPIQSNGHNQYLLMYYRRTAQITDLIIEYRKDTPDGPEIRPSSTIPLPVGIETPVNVPGVEDYQVKSYVKEGDPTEILTEEGAQIIMIGDPTKPVQKIIIIYTQYTDTPKPDGEPTIITPDDNIEKVFLYANAKGAEEYDVEKAIPTSEDLYISGDVYSYRFVSEMNQKDYTETINVVIRQPYYTDLDDTSKVKYITVTLNDLDLVYNYYEIAKAELYDLKALHLENGAIKYYNSYNYDTGEFGVYTEGEANFPVIDRAPYIEYTLPTGVANNDENARIQINSTSAYTVTYDEDDDIYIITINDIDYYEAVDRAGLENQLRNEAMAIIEKCTKVKVQTLNIKLDGEDDVVILTGDTYDLPEKDEALDTPIYYIPYVAGRTPLESYFYDKDLYVREEAENLRYDSAVTGDYRLIAEIPTPDSETITTYDPVGPKLSVEEIKINQLEIHTPIVNKTTLTPSDVNKKSVQINNSIKTGLAATTTVLTLDEKFTISIPNKGDHINVRGYGDGITYNHGGLTVHGTENDSNTGSRINPKSNNDLMKPGIIINTPSGAVIDKNKIDMLVDAEGNSIDERNAIGPSFAEYKLIKFPYDVYLQDTDAESPAAGKPQLFKAGEWYNLYEYIRPATTDYTFVIPTWVQDASIYQGENGIQVLIAAENCSLEILENAMKNPMSVKNSVNNEAGKNTTYILRKSFDTYVSGRLYDLEIRDTDDTGYMGKLKQSVRGIFDSLPFNPAELPLAQKGQLPAYNMGLKLGYRFYFDLKTKGIANKEIDIEPKIYYVSTTGTVTQPEDITLFYHSKDMLYNKLDSTHDLNVKMIMANTHGQVNNPIYNGETIVAKILNTARVFTKQSVIGGLVSGLRLMLETEELPYNNIEELTAACGFGTDTASFVASAIESETIVDENSIKKASGHWYGEYYLPSSTNVVLGRNVDRTAVVNGTVKPLTTGYLIITFEEIVTEDSINPTGGYLTYEAPSSNTQREKEGIDECIVLPNGISIQLKDSTGKPVLAPMAIYQVGLRANNDFETEGTH